MLFFPEACDYIAESKPQSVEMAERLDGDLMSRFCQAARDNKLWLSVGGFHQKVSSSLGESDIELEMFPIGEGEFEDSDRFWEEH